MKKKRKQVTILFLVFLSISFLLLFKDLLWDKGDKGIYKISVIARGKSSEGWYVMKKGIDQAALEMNANISFITLSQEDKVEEQKELIAREIKNGADAILISPVDYKEIGEIIDIASARTNFVMIESTVKSSNTIPYISCDNYNLGVSLAEEMMQMGNTRKRVAIIKNNLECSSIMARYNGFMDTIKKTKNTYEYIELSSSEKDAYSEGERLFKEGMVDAIVTFDSGELEAFGEAKHDLIKVGKELIPIEVYGVGSTSKILSLIEEKVITSTAIQNEFNIGYLGVQTAVNIIKGGEAKLDNSTIDSTVINYRNMYSKENERLLFPFIR